MMTASAKKKITALLLTVLLSVVFVMPVHAVQTIDLKKTDGTIRLEMVFYGRGEPYPMSGGEMSLYLVAPAAVGDTGYYFDTANGRFAGTEEAESIREMDSSELSANNAELALALTGYTENMEADQTAVIADGEVLFTGLKPGLYLIAMTKEDDTGATITPFMMSLPDAEGNYDIYARPKPEIEPPEPEPEPSGGEEIPQTGQLWWPVPVMAAAGILLFAAGIMLRRRSDLVQ